MKPSSTVIKAPEAQRQAGRLTVFSFSDIQAEAEAIIERARAQAEQAAAAIREASVKRAAELYEQRRRQGYEEGLAAGLEAGKAEALAEAQQTFQARHATLAAAMGEAVARFDAQKEAWLSAVHRDAVELVMEIARRVVRRIGKADRDAAVESLRQVIERVGHGRDIAVRLSPADVEAVRTFAETLAADCEQWRHVRLIADKAVEPGGCVVETGPGTVDATLAKQLDRIAAELVPWRGESE